MAEVEQVKSVQFNWVNFLYENLAYIRRHEREGNLPYALKLLCTFVFYCPHDVKEQFADKASRIIEELGKFSGRLQGISVLDRHLKVNKGAMLFAKDQFYHFMQQVTDYLDKKGYMERKSYVPEGRSHTEKRIAAHRQRG